MREVDGRIVAAGHGPQQKAPASSAADGGLSLCGGGLGRGNRDNYAAAGLKGLDHLPEQLELTGGELGHSQGVAPGGQEGKHCPAPAGRGPAIPDTEGAE